MSLQADRCPLFICKSSLGFSLGKIFYGPSPIRHIFLAIVPFEPFSIVLYFCDFCMSPTPWHHNFRLQLQYLCYWSDISWIYTIYWSLVPSMFLHCKINILETHQNQDKSYVFANFFYKSMPFKGWPIKNFPQGETLRTFVFRECTPVRLIYSQKINVQNFFRVCIIFGLYRPD